MSKSTYAGSRTKRQLAVIALLSASGLGALLLAPVVAVEVDDMLMPTVDQAHLPSGADGADRSVECASGGCWLRLSFAIDDLSTEIRQEMLEIDGRCRPISILDRRKVCVTAGRDASTLVVDLSFKRSLGL